MFLVEMSEGEQVWGLREGKLSHCSSPGSAEGAFRNRGWGGDSALRTMHRTCSPPQHCL